MLSCLRATKLQLYLIPEQVCGQLVMASEAVTETVTAFAEMVAAASEVRSTSTSERNGGHSTDPEYRRGKKSAVQCVQRRDLLVVRLGGVLRGVTLLPLRHLIPIVVALMAFIDALANVWIVVPIDRAGRCLITANLVRRQIFYQSAFFVSVDFDRSEARVGEHRFGFPHGLGL